MAASQKFNKTPVNGLGIAGFVTSLSGLILTCGLLCPVGLLMSFIALFRAPRGFAWAGTIIGAIGSSIWVLVAGIAIFGAEEAEEHYRKSPVAVHVVTRDVKECAELIEALEEREGRLLSFAEIRAKLEEEDMEDPWGRDILVRATEKGEREVLSLGRDGIEGSDDDVIRRLRPPSLRPVGHSVGR